MKGVIKKELNSKVPKSVLIIFRIVLFACALYFILLGILMMVFPEIVTKNAGVQHPTVLGILRGAGSAMIVSTLFYIFIALKPFERKWAAFIIAIANILAIVIDFTSVLLGEYTISNAMIDVPIETLSFLTLILFYSVYREK